MTIEKLNSPSGAMQEDAAPEQLKARRALIRRLASAAVVPVIVAAAAGAPRSADAGSGP
jgi:hypothetical protein